MYILIIGLPLMSAIIAGLMGRHIGEQGAKIITTGHIVAASLLSWINFFKNETVELKIGEWIGTGGLVIESGLLFDNVTKIMLVLVTTVSALVHLYSTKYMEGDPHVPRFMSYLSLFTLMMVILVTADNYLQMFIGWEGVGVCSYLLINFWFTRIQANKSAMQAMIMNRIGDVGLCIGMFIIYRECGSLHYGTVFNTIELASEWTVTLIGICLLIGAVGKSAQIGLHTWLPTAMEGPTPVSALIHAATMVTAGVFLLIRSSPLLEYSPSALVIIMIVGTMTALLAASIGLVQNDIKKVIAYSTCSQLGYMVMAVGASNYGVSLFHLFNHGFFKAGLFLSAGAIIHAVGDDQDMRKYGGLISAMPLTYAVMLVASLSLMGWPFLTGFYSKDAILELVYARYSVEGMFAYWLGTLAAMMTAYYSFRLIYLTFLSAPKGSQAIWRKAHEPEWQMTTPLVILGFASIFVGYLFKDSMIGLGSSFLIEGIYQRPVMTDNSIDSEYIVLIAKWAPVLLSIVGATLAIVGNHLEIKIPKVLEGPMIFLVNKWNIDQVYNMYIGKPLMSIGHTLTYKTLDRGYIELMGPEGITRGVRVLSKAVSSLQAGWVYNYAFAMLLFTTIIATTVSF